MYFKYPELLGVAIVGRPRIYSWDKVRKFVLQIDGGCKLCKNKEKLECHHIKKRTTHPNLSNDPDNLITVCKRCHDKLRGREEDFELRLVGLL